MTSEPKHTGWCKRQHAILSNHGRWAVPRSGLVFQKTEKGFALDNVMPFTDDMGMASVMGRDVPSTPEELLDYQRNDFACIRRHFKAARLEVTDPRKLLK
jgi:hypothetical protein